MSETYPNHIPGHRKNDLFIYLIVHNVDLFIGWPLILYTRTYFILKVYKQMIQFCFSLGVKLGCTRVYIFSYLSSKPYIVGTR